jgi:uracil-DNA glycosylase family 4
MGNKSFSVFNGIALLLYLVNLMIPIRIIDLLVRQFNVDRFFHQNQGSMKQVQNLETAKMKKLLLEIRGCRVCEQYLELGANPVVAAGASAKIIIIGQAPGKKVHETGIPWDDKSGDNLRAWLGIDKPIFYDAEKVALMPMGFCYPGKGKSGDLAPRPECAPLWHKKLLALMKESKLILLIGHYAQNYYLGEKAKDTLTETVHAYKEYLPDYFPLPHPSPRNNIWQSKNAWFGKDLLPELKKKVKSTLAL